MTPRFVADEDFNNRILAGVSRRLPSFDVIRIHEHLPRGTPDPIVLDWCAANNRLLLTHDASTMPLHFKERLEAGKVGVGVFIAFQQANLGPVIDDLVLIAGTTDYENWLDFCCYLPLS